jgi:hypothetical protein
MRITKKFLIEIQDRLFTVGAILQRLRKEVKENGELRLQKASLKPTLNY